MNTNSIITLTEENIRRAIADYTAHTYQTDGIEDVSDVFIERLARDSVAAKSDLRNLFATSPSWNNELQAIVLSGTRNRKPNSIVVSDLADKILMPAKYGCDYEKLCKINSAVRFFTNPEEDSAAYIKALTELAPRAYAPNKKLSRIFRALCDALGITDNTAGSDFQRLFAQIADELATRPETFQLYVSINPAHFLTMSNPKEDERGSTMVSCHSFNSTEYSFNCGCSGYARDTTSFIVFTASDPKNPETLNNRKTSRQVFAYKPNHGLLLQSRMYTTKSNDSYGGINGVSEDSKLYLTMIQKEIAELEGAPNSWKTYPYVGNGFVSIFTGSGFGGYADWTYKQFGAQISLRDDKESEYEPFKVGTYGLCVKCGSQIASGLYCDDCTNDRRETCDDCGERCHNVIGVYDRHGDYIYVCEDCLDAHYYRCYHCDEFYDEEIMTRADGEFVCQNCLEEHYTQCHRCGDFHDNYSVYTAVDSDGDEVWICEECRDYEYEECHECGRYVCVDDAVEVCDYDGDSVNICPDCRQFYRKCWECGKLYHKGHLEDGLCPTCRKEE